MTINACPVLTTPQVLGVDISKAWFDVCLHPGALRERFDNSAAGFDALLRWLDAVPLEIAVMEATGGLEAPLFDALQAAGLPVARINPRWIRDFARATGRNAKTDQQDATMIALYGATIRPAPDRICDRKTSSFKALCARRRQILNLKCQEMNRQQQARDPRIETMIRQTIAFLDGQLAAIEAMIDKLIQQDAEWRRRRQIIESVPGLAAATARTLIAELPELGTIGNKQIAALVGVAPINRDSGKQKGYRAIGGGRPGVRRILYMAVMGAATRNNKHLVRLYKRMIAAGKKPKVAIVALMRKIIVILNTMIRNDETWQENRLQNTV